LLPRWRLFGIIEVGEGSKENLCWLSEHRI
jgi:hypothetical protein